MPSSSICQTSQKASPCSSWVQRARQVHQRHPEFAAGMRNTTHITLAPLSREETARLVSALLETTVIPADLQQPILERAGGNPLYVG